MAITVTGIQSTEELILSLDTTTKRRVVKTLLTKGKQLQQLAIKMAPVDEGNLEQAIKIRPEIDGGRIRDDLGRFAKVDVEVYVDMDMPAPQRPGKTVGDYAYEIHEHLTPMGRKQLGEKSANKNQSNDGVTVGGGFMARAAEQIERGIDAELAAILNDIL